MERLFAFCVVFVVLFIGMSYVSGIPVAVLVGEATFQLGRILNVMAHLLIEKGA